TALHFRVNDGDGALETTLGRFDYVRIRDLLGRGLEFGKAGRHDFGDMALLVPLGDGNRLVQLAFLESSGNLLHENPRLLASRAVHQGAVDHYAERINRENEKDRDNDPGKRAH